MNDVILEQDVFALFFFFFEEGNGNLFPESYSPKLNYFKINFQMSFMVIIHLYSEEAYTLYDRIP